MLSVSMKPPLRDYLMRQGINEGVLRLLTSKQRKFRRGVKICNMDAAKGNDLMTARDKALDETLGFNLASITTAPITPEYKAEEAKFNAAVSATYQPIADYYG